MARPLRIQFPNAIYHVISRGCGRRKIFHGEGDYTRFCLGIEATVMRFGFEVFSFVLMPNHVHLFLRTPEPNLSEGMQYLLSGYGNWYVVRHQRPGHVFQGRYKGERIEDETYFWTVSRYIDLNPVRGKRPLVTHPRDWRWSSYAGYDVTHEQVPWIDYRSVYRAWSGQFGGEDPQSAYRSFVESGLDDPPESPFRAAAHGWILGCADFVDQMRKLAKEPRNQHEVPLARRLARLELPVVLKTVADHYGVPVDTFRQRSGPAPCRDMAAWLARRYTTATLRELSSHFGLSHPDSVRNLVRRIDLAANRSNALRDDIEKLQQTLAISSGGMTAPPE